MNPSFQYLSHQPKCSKNWDGTAGGMEKEGAKRIFQRSIEKSRILKRMINGSNQLLELRYKYMISDGDSRAYDAVKNIYVDTAKEDLRFSDRSNGVSSMNFFERTITIFIRSKNRRQRRYQGRLYQSCEETRFLSFEKS